jgi:Mg2+/citrate symporter
LKVFSIITQVFYYAVLPIFCLVTAFFRVEEVQATDAV